MLVGSLTRLEIEATDDAPAKTLEMARRLVPAKANRWTQFLPHLAAAAVLVLAVGVLFNVRQEATVRSESDYRITRGVTAAPQMQVIAPASAPASVRMSRGSVDGNARHALLPRPDRHGLGRARDGTARDR